MANPSLPQAVLQAAQRIQRLAGMKDFDREEVAKIAGKDILLLWELGAFTAPEFQEFDLWVERDLLRCDNDGRPQDKPMVAFMEAVHFIARRDETQLDWHHDCIVLADALESLAMRLGGERIVGAETEQRKGDGGADESNDWISVSDAARISGVNKGSISRAANSGEITTNGMSGRARRLHSGSFAQWVLQRSPTTEGAPDPEEIVRRAKEERRKRGVGNDD